jgi:hypothetical protein
MFEKLINLIFGSSHPERHHSALPFTQDGKSYRVCLKCGTPIAYSVEDFQYVTPGYLRRKMPGGRTRLEREAVSHQKSSLRNTNPQHHHA